MSDKKQIVPASDRLRQQGNFTRVPNEIIEHNELSPQAKMVWIELWKFCYHEDDGAFPGMKRIGEELNYHQNTVRKYRQELEDFDLLDVEHRGQGQTNLYYLYTPDLQTGVDQDSQGRVDQEPQTGVRKEDEGEEDEVEEYKENTYMLSPYQRASREGEESMLIYLEMFRDKVGGKHDNVKPNTYYEASTKLSEHYKGYGEDKYIEDLTEYFDDEGRSGLPKLSHFNEVAPRYFL